MTNNNNAEFSMGKCDKCNQHDGLRKCSDCGRQLCCKCLKDHECGGVVDFLNTIFNPKKE